MGKVMELLVIGLSHRTAPVQVRERLAIVPAEIEARLKAVVQLPCVREVVLISTCNRVEFYASTSDGAEALGAIRGYLHDQVASFRPGSLAARGSGAGDFDLDRHLYRRVGREAAHHLFRVAASLDSLVVGEPQILGQVKDAFECAQRCGTIGPVLGTAFQNAFRVARRVRRDTGIARQPTSVSSVAVERARQVWEGFAGRRVLLIGAGKMSDLAARSLTAQGAAVVVTNRTAARAQELAARLGCDTAPFHDLAALLAKSDIVITSTGSREPLLTATMMEGVQRARRGRPLVVIDIAVPRDVEPQVGDLDGVFLWDIDALQKVAAENLDGRRQEADLAEVMVEEELARFLADHHGRTVGPTIAAMRARFTGVARGEAEKALASLAGLDERQKNAIAAMADAIANKLLHAPSVMLKKGAATQEGEALAQAAHRLFELPDVDVLADEAGEDGKKASGS